MEATGWAVISAFSNKIFVKTVGETRRAAIVNYLVAEQQKTISPTMTDDEIEALWEYFSKHSLCTKVSVAMLPVP